MGVQRDGNFREYISMPIERIYHGKSCRRGHVSCCHDNQTMGVQRDGSFREYISMPIERIYHGKGLDLKTLALIEPFSIGWHAVSSVDFLKFEKSGINPKILVIGAGPIGLFALISAK